MNRTPGRFPSRHALPIGLVLMAGLALLGACTEDDDLTGPGSGSPPVVDGVGAISGVVSTTGGFPASGHAVTAGGVTAQTNEDGYFVLSRVPAGETLLRVGDEWRYTLRWLGVTEGGNIHLPDLVLPSYRYQIFESADGATIASSDGAANVVIAAESLVTETGIPYDGQVSARLTALRPQDGDFYGAYPGRFSGIRADASEVPRESFGFLTIQLSTTYGDPLRLAPGATAVLRLAVSGDWVDLATPTVPVWQLDTGLGEWTEESSASLANNVYSATVNRLGTFDFAPVVDSLCGVTGFVVNDSGQPAAGVRVISQGVDHRFRDESVTNADGLYTVRALASSITDVWAMSGSIAGEFLRVSVGNECPERAAENLVVTVPAYSIALTWGAEPPDLDSHLLIPMTWDSAWDYYHVAYYNMGRLGQHPYAVLDVDDTSAYGPEIITGTRMFQGRFQYWVHEFETDDTTALAASEAVVQLALGGALYLFEVEDVPLEGADPDGWWHVFDIVVGGSDISLESVMRFRPSPPGDGVYDGEGKRLLK